MPVYGILRKQYRYIIKPIPTSTGVAANIINITYDRANNAVRRLIITPIMINRGKAVMASRSYPSWPDKISVGRIIAIKKSG